LAPAAGGRILKLPFGLPAPCGGRAVNMEGILRVSRVIRRSTAIGGLPGGGGLVVLVAVPEEVGNGGLIASAPWLFNGHVFQRLRRSFHAFALRDRVLGPRFARAARREGEGGSGSEVGTLRHRPRRCVSSPPFLRATVFFPGLVSSVCAGAPSDASGSNWNGLEGFPPFLNVWFLFIHMRMEMRVKSVTGDLTRFPPRSWIFFWKRNCGPVSLRPLRWMPNSGP
jgi:hypothetical protein